METSWLISNLATGQVLGELPDLECSSVSTLIGEYTTTTATVPVVTLPKIVQGWERGILPGGVALVLLLDDNPVWGGMVLRRSRGLGDTAVLSLATLEAYFDRRYVGDEDYVSVPGPQVVADLATKYAADQIPMRIDAAATGNNRSREYLDVNDVTLLSALTELSAANGGPEWTVGWEWSAGHTLLTPVITTASRLGRVVTPGLAPTAVFDAPGSVTDAEFTEDYGEGKGATRVRAVSTGPTAVRPQSPNIFVDPGAVIPAFEHRFTPGMSITSVSRLTNAAEAAAARMAKGARSLTLTAVLDAEDGAVAPRVGTVWDVGDDIGYDITTPTYEEPLRGVARAIGWTIDLGQPLTITPTLDLED